MDKNYLSKERYNELVVELADLKTKGRREVASHLKQAKELGDLSENFEYQEAREEQSRLETKINQLEDILRQSIIIKKTDTASGSVKVGSKVKIKKGGENFVYTVVGSNEAKPAEGLISNESPIGLALLGKVNGDIVIIKTPKGEVKYEIVSVE